MGSSCLQRHQRRLEARSASYASRASSPSHTQVGSGPHSTPHSRLKSHYISLPSFDFFRNNSCRRPKLCAFENWDQGKQLFLIFIIIESFIIVIDGLTFLLSPSVSPLLKDMDLPPSTSGEVSSSKVSVIIGISNTW